MSHHGRYVSRRRPRPAHSYYGMFYLYPPPRRSRADIDDDVYDDDAGGRSHEDLYSDEAGGGSKRRRRRRHWRRRGRIFGVSAWLADRFQVETWVVRMTLLTGLIFMPSVVLPAYIIAAIVLRMENVEPTAVAGRGAAPSPPQRSVPSQAPLPALGPRLSPRHYLSEAQATLDQVELKLRRMEAYVTSGHYELDREFNRLDSQ